MIDNRLLIMKWRDISINKYKRIVDVVERYSEEDIVFHLIGVCFDKTYEQVMDMKYTDVEKLAKEIRFINSSPEVTLVKSSYEINGRKYDAVLDFSKITTSQYIDFQMLAPKSSEMIAEFLSIILIPEGKKYNDGYNLEFVQNEIAEHLSIVDALSLSAFFFELFARYIKSAERKLKRMIRMASLTRMSKEQREALYKLAEMVHSLDGTIASMR